MSKGCQRKGGQKTSSVVEGDVQSLKLIMNYVDGLPKQTVENIYDIDVKTVAVKIIESNQNEQRNTITSDQDIQEIVPSI